MATRLMGEKCRFIIENGDTSFDLTGYIRSLEFAPVFDTCIDDDEVIIRGTQMELNISVIGSGKQLFLDPPENEPECRLEPLKSFEADPDIWRCDYCKQVNDRTQLYCGHCGGEKPE